MLRTLFKVAAPALLVSLAACSSAPPANIDLSLNHASAKGRYVVSLQPPAQTPAINQLHAWTMTVASPDGAPVRGASFRVDGGMPQHGHGLPTRPRVTREIADGTYVIEGMKFSMTGWWEIKLDIRASAGEDAVTFNTVVTDPSSRG